MATKKTKTQYPKITVGSHSTIVEHENGKIEMTWDWDKLNEDINNAIRSSITNNISDKSTKTTATNKQSKRKGKKNEMV